jgi:hypothetical protein
MLVREYYPGEKPYRMVYSEDPFGNLVEIYSHRYELTYSAEHIRQAVNVAVILPTMLWAMLLKI